MLFPKMLVAWRNIKVSRAVWVMGLFPSLMMLGWFYSLAVHMHWSLGAWPSSIGEAGFPPRLVMHARIAWRICEAVTALIIFGLPLPLLVCALVPPWRRFVPALALMVVFFFLCWGLMFLAPAPFLNWWWD